MLTTYTIISFPSQLMKSKNIENTFKSMYQLKNRNLRTSLETGSDSDLETREWNESHYRGPGPRIKIEGRNPRLGSRIGDRYLQTCTGYSELAQERRATIQIFAMKFILPYKNFNTILIFQDNTFLNISMPCTKLTQSSYDQKCLK